MSGFFAFRTGSVDLELLQPDGFKILLEVLATHPELTVEELPYRFGQREGGVSKASVSRGGTRFMGHLVDLRIRTSGAWAGAAMPQRIFRSA